MAQVDITYHELLKDILNNGVKKSDRTGNGTTSVFGRQLRFDVSDNKVPLITTKKMYTKGIIYELFWFLGHHMKDEKYKKFGLTNIKWLVDNNVNIWVGDAYKKYEQNWLRENPPFGGPYENKILAEKEFIEKVKTDDDFAMQWGELGPVYGEQWIQWESQYGHINQIGQILDQLIKNPDSRRIMVNAWNVAKLDEMTLPPCHYGFQLYTRELSVDEIVNYYYNQIKPEQKYRIEEGKYYYHDSLTNMWIQHSDTDILFGIKPCCPSRAISLMWNQRSVDTFLGLPFNIASYAILLHMIANEVNMVTEDLICNLGDTHIYNGHIEAVNEQLERDTEKYESSNISFKTGHKSIFELSPEDIDITQYKSYPTIKTNLFN